MEDFKSRKPKVYKRIMLLIQDIMTNDPFDGLGKPEPLKYNLSGYWSRRINREHRLVYRITDSQLQIYSVKKHYEK
ncbi:MAG: Txe/YoeB family addiction module toxin [Streptococcaceae bacterium]|jgi:toxin YoeB|nr:Txe/YoeB family addiction module toxin [Streptococcaceae bacterium]